MRLSNKRAATIALSAMALSAMALSAVAAAMCSAACSSDRTEFGPPPESFGADAALPDAGGCTTTRCSRDLKAVLSGCSEEVIETCAPGLGCGAGKCVSACEAAELSQGSIGCGFWALPADEHIDNSAGSCFAAIVANTWDTPVTLRAEHGKDALDISRAIYVATANPPGKPKHTRLDGPIVPGGVAIVFLAGRPGAISQCPEGVTPAFIGDPISHGTSRTRAFHLVADAPVSTYSIFPYGGAETAFPSATLLLPATSWTKSYLAVNARPPISATTQSFVQIVAAEDDTVVRMNPRVDIADGPNVVGAQRGFTQSWTLARGEVLQITERLELTGSAIESTKPVGLFGGTRCIYMPDITFGYCDALAQQIPPLGHWGNEYALVPHRPRRGFSDGVEGLSLEPMPWRLVGAADGTLLTYDPAPPEGAPATLAAGEVGDFTSTELVTVRSQDSAHPFFAAQYMTGQQYSSISGGRNIGDPDFVNVVPSDQFLDRYVFFTDFTYMETALTVVRRKTERGFLPVELACAGELTEFRPLGTKGDYEYTWVRLTKDRSPQKIGKGECGYGRHEMTSDGPFAVYVWGMDDAASYGYAGGMGLRSLNEIVPSVPK